MITWSPSFRHHGLDLVGKPVEEYAFDSRDGFDRFFEGHRGKPNRVHRNRAFFKRGDKLGAEERHCGQGHSEDHGSEPNRPLRLSD